MVVDDKTMTASRGFCTRSKRMRTIDALSMLPATPLRRLSAEATEACHRIFTTLLGERQHLLWKTWRFLNVGRVELCDTRQYAECRVSPSSTRPTRWHSPRSVILTVFLALVFQLSFGISAQAADHFHARDLVVVPIGFVEVPAARSGRIIEIKAKPGLEILRGEIVGSMDDRHAMLAIQLAKSELEMAQQRSTSDAIIDAAKSRLESEKQAARQLVVTRDIAKLKAKNDLRVLAAKKSEAVAENEYQRAAESRKQYAQSVSKSEIDSLKLVADKSHLETKQAAFERQIASLEVDAETEAARRQAMAIGQAEAEVDAAQTESAVIKLQLEHRQIQLEVANANLDDHRIVAPIDGRVTKVYKSPGAWATEGESVARIVRLDRLRLEGFAPVERLDRFQNQTTVNVTVVVSGETHQRTGEIVFVDPEIDPVSGEFRYWVDFDNQDRVILPGMRANLEINHASASNPGIQQ